MKKHFDADDDGSQGFTEAEVARIVLELDREVMLARRAAALRQIVHGRPVPGPVKPTHTELAVLAALAQTHGPALLSGEYSPTRTEISLSGGVSLVQRVL